ncbi:MAG TPA: tlde1 domain-containing protein [Candidatus Baltobacteraceae bacterium]|nr:tlde1 domain-containing protein [Candidatus Baltobacteraceae bacterium]
MWTFIQRTGELLHDGMPKGAGYSGAGPGKNNPTMQSDHGVGPIPCGFYSIAGLIDHDPACGEYVLVLTPDHANEMFGRTGFRWHGDSAEHPGQASHGCIVSARALRSEAWDGDDHNLHVISGL